MSLTLERESDLLDRRDDAPTPFRLAERVENGLPIATMEQLAHMVAPDDANFVYRLVPRATIARRRAQPETRLTIDESARVLRLYAVWDYARRVWKDDAAARRFLFKPHMLLEGRRPIDVVLVSEFGRPLVENILGSLLYGTGV
jgi:putative toxin-antitoxin system antitoxin component (TIGR02293 family)